MFIVLNLILNETNETVFYRQCSIVYVVMQKGEINTDTSIRHSFNNFFGYNLEYNQQPNLV